MSKTVEKDEPTELLDRLYAALQPYHDQVREELKTAEANDLFEGCCMMSAFSTISLFRPALSEAERAKLMQMVLHRFAERLLVVARLEHIADIKVVSGMEVVNEPAAETATKH